VGGQSKTFDAVSDEFSLLPGIRPGASPFQPGTYSFLAEGNLAPIFYAF